MKSNSLEIRHQAQDERILEGESQQGTKEMDLSSECSSCTEQADVTEESNMSESQEEMEEITESQEKMEKKTSVRSRCYVATDVQKGIKDDANYAVYGTVPLSVPSFKLNSDRFPLDWSLLVTENEWKRRFAVFLFLFMVFLCLVLMIGGISSVVSHRSVSSVMFSYSTAAPSDRPTFFPTEFPTVLPSFSPSFVPTQPTVVPTVSPTSDAPTHEPTFHAGVVFHVVHGRICDLKDPAPVTLIPGVLNVTLCATGWFSCTGGKCCKSGQCTRSQLSCNGLIYDNPGFLLQCVDGQVLCEWTELPLNYCQSANVCYDPRVARCTADSRNLSPALSPSYVPTVFRSSYALSNASSSSFCYFSFIICFVFLILQVGT
jgi:hypothetical protein